ncbi:MAG TPA: LacI family DNA-binding transcriptional regulator [Amaricoccus sp.]|uniref:LacI family DNA-binding transcriptional regulator n=2 Tax=Amaricoccus sp. TaxID=1872485 RepID=UPI002B817013|nr:LacI family DNA-binding transcriptional regulator [Amaricoccus sp.]HMR52840.1 LacI family DNA-binding transcriptional regulator [Amaricoccus sp.]HMR60814.1 LacI family DNA-binding transcriptional regulator [Amaricoccus sp.]HMT99775.1 LacI family DNA-binding transcriptional regulator [Amaricoccus sp.]
MSTIYDVAKRAGVSPKTVSRFLNGDAPVGRSTRDKVERAIAELGYVPSSAARTMRSNRSGLVGLITGAITLTPRRMALGGLPDIEIVQGILRELEESGLTLLISDTGGKSERIPNLIRTFQEHRVEGIIFVADHHMKVTLPGIAGDTKLVLANCFDDAGSPAVLPNDRSGQKALTEGLIARGHRRIAYLTLGPEMKATRLRVAGYRDALAIAGIPFDPALVTAANLSADDHLAEEQLLWDALDRVLTIEDPPTVLCLGNDRMALRAYGMLRSRGLTLPDDISVAGYDDHTLITETLYPQLTTVKLPYAAMGVRAARLLTSMVRDGSAAPEAPVLVGGPAVWRDSVRPGPANRITELPMRGRNPA